MLRENLGITDMEFFDELRIYVCEMGGKGATTIHFVGAQDTFTFKYSNPKVGVLICHFLFDDSSFQEAHTLLIYTNTCGEIILFLVTKRKIPDKFEPVVVTFDEGVEGKRRDGKVPDSLVVKCRVDAY